MENEAKLIISSKSTADVYFNDKIIRIFGELGLDSFLASKEDMKWLKPTYLKDKSLTPSEQQKIIDLVYSYNHRQEIKIYFKNDNPENLILLKEELTKRKVSEKKYCLAGEKRNRMCIVPNGNKWEVFYSKGRTKVDIKLFDDERSACKYLLSMLSKG